MHKRDLVSSVFFLGIAVLVIIGSFQYSTWDRYGPGPGLFPLFLGVVFLGLSLILFLNAVLIHLENKGPGLTERRRQSLSDLRPVVKYLVSVLLFYVLFEPLGYLLTIFLFMVFVLKMLAGKSLKFSLFIAIPAALFVSLVFVNLLGVTFPEGILQDFFYRVSVVLKNGR